MCGRMLGDASQVRSSLVEHRKWIGFEFLSAESSNLMQMRGSSYGIQVRTIIESDLAAVETLQYVDFTL